MQRYHFNTINKDLLKEENFLFVILAKNNNLNIKSLTVSSNQVLDSHEFINKSWLSLNWVI